jgi:mannose-6-phosphate isomerase-like protein (cupin superfamily)
MESSHDQPQTRILKHKDWSSDDKLWKGNILGTDLGTDITVLAYSTEEIGVGPKWHVHPYDEVFIIRKGRALFTIGDEKIEAEAGDVLMGPANIPHKYHNLGPGLLESTDIHLSRTWIQTNLDDPELSGA